MAEKKLTSYPKEKINILFLENISDVAVKHFNVSGYENEKKINLINRLNKTKTNNKKS